jgi:hypothetical protein
MLEVDVNVEMAAWRSGSSSSRLKVVERDAVLRDSVRAAEMGCVARFDEGESGDRFGYLGAEAAGEEEAGDVDEENCGGEDADDRVLPDSRAIGEKRVSQEYKKEEGITMEGMGRARGRRRLRRRQGTYDCHASFAA